MIGFSITSSTLKFLLPSDIANYWAKLLPFICPVKGLRTLDEIRSQLESGHAQAWYCQEGAWITKIYPDYGVIWMCSGKLAAMLPYLPLTEKYLKSHGCNFVRIEGRRGWLKALDGYEEEFTVMKKTL